MRPLPNLPPSGSIAETASGHSGPTRCPVYVDGREQITHSQVPRQRLGNRQELLYGSHWTHRLLQHMSRLTATARDELVSVFPKSKFKINPAPFGNRRACAARAQDGSKTLCIVWNAPANNATSRVRATLFPTAVCSAPTLRHMYVAKRRTNGASVGQAWLTVTPTRRCSGRTQET